MIYCFNGQISCFFFVLVVAVVLAYLWLKATLKTKTHYMQHIPVSRLLIVKL